MKPAVCARAIAHPNIALAKYWGKLDRGKNLPSVPSLSVTLAGMATHTEVTLGADADELELDGAAVHGRALERVSALLDLIWAHKVCSDPRPRARVRSRNDFPTSSGLASSASAFAALAVAGYAVLDVGLSPGQLSHIARQISASAGRSLFGGFVELPAGHADQASLGAVPLAGKAHWDLRLVVAVTTEEKKDVASTEGMLHTERTSVFYDAWVQAAPTIYQQIRAAVLARDFMALGPPVEQSALAMHASALAADPGLIYWNGTTIRVLHAVRRLRAAGWPAFFTIDAGPHVKVLTLPEKQAQLEHELGQVEGVVRIIAARPGDGARLETECRELT